MPYVERRDLRVVGRYARPQPGYAEEWLDDGHPDLAETVEEKAAEKAAKKQARLQQLVLEALPEILAYIADKADAPIKIKDKAVELEAEKIK